MRTTSLALAAHVAVGAMTLNPENVSYYFGLGVGNGDVRLQTGWPHLPGAVAAVTLAALAG
ncbi:MAG: hypothetical protein H6659_10865 [Ardenticatenaceae bacterium]|nr:hypothetical protein [Ardenticatenaceae bacterium]